ncbi:uncharacterized protein [Dermacentor andersoni]|uniref:uncharacterized protein n=1 Tax=Dermacentor andersoni TaxID=34620 RepID=UPI003B3A82A4
MFANSTNLSLVSQNIALFFYIDGLPLSKSSLSQFWPILASTSDIPGSGVFLVGCYHGNQKPSSLADFLGPLVKDLLHLLDNGLQVHGKPVTISVKGFICDAPARAFILGTKLHSGYYGCGKCKQKGEYAEGRVVFPETQAPLRTDADFDQRVQEEHHVSETPLSALPIGLVSQFPLDYMHLVCIGVTKKLILLWLRGPLPHRLPSTSIERMSKWLLALARTHCEEFARRPRSLREIDRWKATELRCFLLYLGPCVLRGILSKNLYNHFLILHTAITILSSPSLCREYCSYAKELLVCFVSSFQSHYGKHTLSYNVHSLVHLADDVLRYGPLDSFSAFPAENFMHHLKKLVRHSKKPLEQLVNRMAERLSSGTLFVIKQLSLEGVECSQIHSSGPLAECCIGPQYFYFTIDLMKLNSFAEPPYN